MINSTKGNSWGEIAITIAFTSFIILPLILYVRISPPLRYNIQDFIISSHLAFLALVVFFFIVFQKDKHKNFLSNYDLLPLLFFFLVLISFSLVPDLLASLQSVLWWLEAIIFYYICLFVFSNTSIRERFLYLMPACGVLLTIFFTIYVFASNEIKKEILIFPFAMNRNFVAQILILPLFVSFSFINKKYRRGTRSYAVLSAFVMFSGILITRSRAVWLGVLLVSSVALLWLLLFYRTQFKKFLKKELMLKLLFLSAGLCVSIYLAHMIMPEYNLPSPLSTLETLEKPLEGSAGGRIHRWINAFPMIRDHFFLGVGPGNWTQTFYKYRDGVTTDPLGNPQAFNSYLEVFGEIGIFGVLILTFFILSLFRRNYKDYPQVPCLKLSLGAFLFAAAFHLTFSVKVLLIAFFLNIALLSSYEDCRHRSFAINKRLIVPLSLVILLVLFVTTFFEFRCLESNIHYQLIKNHVFYAQETPTISFNRLTGKSTRVLRKYIEKYFPAIFYREHPEAIDSLAAYGSWRRQDLYQVIAVKEESAGRKEALDWYKKAEKKNPYKSDIIEACCKAERKFGLLSDARATCEQGCEIFSHNESLHLELARIYSELEQSQKAITFYEKAISLHEKQLKVNWFGKAGAEKRLGLVNALKEANQELSELRKLSNNLKLSSIQRKILEVPLINKDIALRKNEVFFSTNKSGRYELWVWKSDNSLQQLSNDNHVYFRLRPHPKLPRLYFVSDDFGNARYNIYYRDLNTNDIVRLTEASNGESIGLHEISSDGKNIIYVKESKQREGEIYQMNPDGRNIRQLTSDRRQKEYLSWHPSSNQFVYVAGKHSLMFYDVLSSGKSTLVKEQFKEIKWPSFSPDGTKIVFARVDLRGYGSIEVYDFNNKKINLLTPKIGRYLTPHWMSQDTILFRENKDDNYLLRLARLNTEEVRHIGPHEGVVYDPEIIDSGPTLVFLHSGVTAPLSLNRLNLDTNHQKTIRFDSLTKKEIVLPERKILLSHERPIPVYIYKPLGFVRDDKYPCIIWLHGASDAFSPRWHTYAQFFAHSGYFFVAVNYREALSGSQRQTKQKELDLQKDAVNTALRYLNLQKQVDKTKIFLLGVSQGTLLARYITRSNMFNFAGVIEYSPATMSQSDALSAYPRLIVWGKNDPHRLRSISTVKNNYINPKYNTVVITLGDEGHDLRFQSNIISQLKHTLLFLGDNGDL
jgi:dipeptidyl aminopeptidase/acylaminoacyl peptidase/O-antigen ligase